MCTNYAIDFLKKRNELNKFSLTNEIKILDSLWRDFTFFNDIEDKIYYISIFYFRFECSKIKFLSNYASSKDFRQFEWKQRRRKLKMRESLSEKNINNDLFEEIFKELSKQWSSGNIDRKSSIETIHKLLQTIEH